jgi:hypothetical protein
MYKLFTNNFGNQIIIRISDNANIPADPANTDYQQYQQYLAWLTEGNTPLPADEA